MHGWSGAVRPPCGIIAAVKQWPRVYGVKVKSLRLNGENLAIFQVPEICDLSSDEWGEDISVIEVDRIKKIAEFIFDEEELKIGTQK